MIALRPLVFEAVDNCCLKGEMVTVGTLCLAGASVDSN